MLESINCISISFEFGGRNNTPIPPVLRVHESAIMAVFLHFFISRTSSKRAMRATTFPLCSPGLFHHCKNPPQQITARTNHATSRISPGQLKQLEQSDQNQGLRSNGPLRNLLFPLFPGSLSQIKSIPAARQPGASERLRSAYYLWRVRISGKDYRLPWLLQPNGRQALQVGSRVVRAALQKCGWSLTRLQFAPRRWSLRFTGSIPTLTPEPEAFGMAP